MKYTIAYEVAEVTIRCREGKGYLFPPGAAREIALAAVPCKDDEDVVKAMREEILKLELHPFDDPHDEEMVV